MGRVRCAYCSASEEVPVDNSSRTKRVLSYLKHGWKVYTNWTTKTDIFFCDSDCESKFRFKKRNEPQVVVIRK